MIEALVAALGGLLRLVDAPLDHLDVRHDELKVDDVNVAQGIGTALNVGDVRVVKAADNVNDGVRGTDVGKEFIAETLAMGRALYKTRDVHKLNDGGCELLWVVLIPQPLQPLIRHGHNAHVRVNGAERVVVRGHARVGDGIEQRGLADVRQPDDT